MSKQISSAGVSRESRWTRESAGWMRWDKLSQSSRCAPGGPARTTISASMAHRGGRCAADRLDHFREVAGQRFGAAAGQLHLVAVAQHDAPEAVPLGFIGQASRDGVGRGHTG